MVQKDPRCTLENRVEDANRINERIIYTWNDFGHFIYECMLSGSFLANGRLGRRILGLNRG